ncbi:MAG: PVC-type heme-binding CxxCH protein [Planctomycetota bacterium]|nr:PVC-type heme-binding CxxCH protein [Planctomycetota bacterium]
MRWATFLNLGAILVTLAATTTSQGQNGDRSGETQRDLPEEWRLPPSPPLSPREARERFVLQPGHRIELVAAEPLIGDPVQAVFDASGDLWVCEMRGYMPDADGNGEEAPIGRIVRLRDHDEDGRMDEATTFLDHLVLPRAIAPAFDGLLVVEPPNLLYCRDTDGDGRADDTQVLVSGFKGIENPEHAGNGLRYGIDNWYETSQHHHAFRLHRRPDGRLAVETRRVPGHGQWGVARDDLGRLFYSPNSDPLISDAYPKHYAARNPEADGLPGVPRRAARDRSTWPARINPGVNRGYQDRTLRDDGTLRSFTAACGPEIFRGTALADARGDAFVCETAGNLVKRYELEDRNGVPVATPTYDQEEFLASTDERFRPVNLLTGPDGGLYVVDFARGVVQHRIYMTTWLRKQVEERGLAAPVGRGRIWRIVDEDAPRTVMSHDFAALSDEDLVEVVRVDPNGVNRDTAQRLLVERSARTVADELADLARDPSLDPPRRLQALWILESFGDVDPDLLTAVAEADEPVVREHVARVAESLPPHLAVGVLTPLVEDEDSRVRIQAVLSLGSLPSEQALPALDDVLARRAADPTIRRAVLAGLAGREIEMLRTQGRPSGDGWLGREGAAQRHVLREMVDPMLERGGSDQATALLALATGWSEEAPGPSLVVIDRVAARTRPDSRKPRRLNLRGEPVGWTEVIEGGSDDCDPRVPVAARRIDATLAWPGRPGHEQVIDYDTSAAGLVNRGRSLFAHCMTCHQANGRGLPPVYPPLDESHFVTGSPERLARILMHGLQGRIEVQGRTYDQAMPAAPFKKDADIAAIMTYIRQAWNNDADPVTPEFVAEVRKATSDRRQPWTPSELAEWSEPTP